MTQRTCNIIKACKDCFHYDNIDKAIDRVKQYMSEECACPLKYYTYARMDKIMFDAMCDYIDTCDRPSSFLREMDNLCNKEYYSHAERIAIIFTLIQVKENGQYINGFTADMWTDRK